ncbi:MAG: MFS transporter [Gammaproteobacteria bacterium]|nr:MFS transporter [Gammaproteobacteria bacterium]
MAKSEFKIVGLTALGGTLEFYDFTIYALFAPYISQHFFYNTDPLIGVMNTFAVFALGYLARPLGGIVFGHLGDKWGRKIAFLWAVLMMAMATLAIGCLPDYHSIGIIAPMALIVLRLIQGFSVGGEIPGATLFTFEHVAAEKRGLFIGVVFMCITLGNTLGGLVGLVLTHILNETQMMAWGWRVPFILGFLLGIISFYIRKKLVETPVFIQMVAMKQLQDKPFLRLLKQTRVNIVKAFLLTASISTISSFLIYLPTYLSTMMNIKVSSTYLINVVSFLSIALMTAVWGRVSDYYNRRRLMIIGTSLLMVLVVPLFYGLTTWGIEFIWIFILIFAVICGMINSCYVILITELFPANLRYSGVAFSYSLGFALIAGSAPLVFTALIQSLHRVEAPAFYIAACSLLTLMATLFYNGKTRHSPIEEMGPQVAMEK